MIDGVRRIGFEEGFELATEQQTMQQVSPPSRNRIQAYNPFSDTNASNASYIFSSEIEGLSSCEISSQPPSLDSLFAKK